MGDVRVLTFDGCFIVLHLNHLLHLQERCNGGRLYDCQFYDADAWVCMSSARDRRYDWVEYEDGTVLGNKGRCPSE